jgi:hypothetical protein
MEPNVNHDPLVFSNGDIVLLTRFHQHAAVLRMPATPPL